MTEQNYSIACHTRWSVFFFFFFLIGNMSTIIDEIIKKKHTMCSWEWTTAKHKTENKNKNNYGTKVREEKNYKREEQSVKPQHWD